jgi:phage baseplate assembly protein W
MGAFNFKSSGKTQEQQVIESLVKSPLPIGIMTPLREGGADGLFKMHYSLLEQVHDNLRNLLLTNWGERLGLYNFGANLRPLTTEFSTLDDFDASAIERIRDAVTKWMPYVSLQDFISEIDRTENKNTGIIRLSITYVIPTLQSSSRALQLSLYVI